MGLISWVRDRYLLEVARHLLLIDLEKMFFGQGVDGVIQDTPIVGHEFTQTAFELRVDHNRLQHLYNPIEFPVLRGARGGVYLTQTVPDPTISNSSC